MLEYPYSLGFLTARRPRSTAKPPINKVSPAIAEAGSISGAFTTESSFLSVWQKLNHRILQSSSEWEADATHCEGHEGERRCNLPNHYEFLELNGESGKNTIETLLDQQTEIA